MPRPIEARIDLAALRHNYLVAKRHAGAARAWAVVKANAYGHGLLRAAAALGEVADGFALLDLDEAIILREAGIRQPILLLEGFFAAADLEICATYGLSVVIHRLEQLQMLRHAALKVPLPIYLKLDSGMHRLGFSCEQIPAARRELTALATAVAPAPVTLMTHFAEADAVGGECCINWQLERFARMLADWPEATSLPISVANSAAILRYPQTAYAWVRPGIMLYGGSPFADQEAESLGLKPVMTLHSNILAVQEIGVGERVGYGGTFVAQRPTRVGVVACGYADGYPRHAPSGTPILVAGEQTQTLGRVSMDMLACDLTDLPGTGVGSPVVLWGQGLPADAVAAAAQTISYELFCALARRVPVVEI
ncbi:MAG: alanine racemase [Candidatus Accumulibacter phosphatis]|uniref:Alanine racemase n=2 Tax=Candidatus Accumulibacter TaxID=327159 RepID=A0A080M7J1_9PROT|nr:MULTISPECIES: alanine racemase [Candidatus Accumulibacter]KFB77247.1 MAG: Alanine racemase, catabolic [Candidatus Accumulibacter cognatus]MBL8399748.1 alanine racemase [Accumulibacter sp.]MBN8518029.1 alanine racemase [Accumulibacter sp.]MBO3710448.1 alanine racemase [Accumulibacter sp.]MCC2867065.1 alanine racemase [Candidatus Accumulibacter phosphatis]